MARPEDIERARAYLDSIRDDATPVIASGPSESILTTKARALQRARQSALVGIQHGDTEPLDTYREALTLYKAYLHLGGHIAQWEAAGMMLMAVRTDDTDTLVRVLTSHKEAIDALHRGAVGS